MKIHLAGTCALDPSTLPLRFVTQLEQTLTLTHRGYNGFTPVPFHFFASGWFHIPRGFQFMPAWHELCAGRQVEVSDGRADGHPINVRADVTFGAHPFPEGQPAFIEGIVKAARANGHGGLCVAPTRAGKTLCGLEAAARLGGTTLILVDRGVILRQWQRAVEEHMVDATGRPVRCGIVRAADPSAHTGERFDHGPGWPFVVATVQTIARRQLPESFREGFRTVLVDECQSAPCDLVFTALQRIASRYVLGLTATPDRSDGLTAAISWVIGPVIAELERRLDADVHFLQMGFAQAKVRDKRGRLRAPRLTFYGKLNMIEIERSLMNDPARVEHVTNEVCRAVQAGRRVLILARLRDSVALMMDVLRHRGLDPGGFMHGFGDQEMEKNPVVGTYGYCKKGVDFQPPPTMCVLFGPIGDVRQAVGRVLQPQAPCRPLVLDVVDGYDPLIKQARRRRAFYQSKGFNILNPVWGGACHGCG